MDVTIYAFYWTKPKVAYVGMTSDVGKRWAEHAHKLQEHLPAYKQIAFDAYNLYGMPMFRRLCIVHDQAKSHTEQVKQAEQAAYERLRDAGWTMCNLAEPCNTYYDGLAHATERQRKLTGNIKNRFGSGKIWRYVQSINVGDISIEPWMHFVIDKANMALFYVWDTRQALFQVDASILPNTYVRVSNDSFEPILGIEAFVTANNRTGHSPSASTRAKIGEANKGKLVSYEARAKLSAANAKRTGEKRSAEARRRIANATKLGMTPEVCARASEARRFMHMQRKMIQSLLLESEQYNL